MKDFWLDFLFEDMGFLRVSLGKKKKYENENYEMKRWVHVVIWLSPKPSYSLTFKIHYSSKATYLNNSKTHNPNSIKIILIIPEFAFRTQ